mmetsp:Transcript_33906/g.81294  ORF Transcript_33906/g.81294 Transcript_33906/m.81294 type:complete len:203 (-) Transcript_33906:741-1349(-)
MSVSAESAQSGGFFFTASAKLFLTHVKLIKRSSWVNPTLSSFVQSLGKSCIMHSRRVGDLNLLFSASAHLGFTNSGTIPPVAAKRSAISGTWNTNTLMFPGKGEKPLASGLSPPAGVSLSRGSSWLYSTLMVMPLPEASFSLQMPPTASPGKRGTATEFMTKPLAAETPRMAHRLLKGKGLVSWNSSSHFLPSFAHLLIRPC